MPDNDPIKEKRYNAGCPPPAGGRSGTVRPQDLCAALDDIIAWLESVRDVVCRIDADTLPLRMRPKRLVRRKRPRRPAPRARKAAATRRARKR
jgi:hypothetical protein